MSIPIPGAQAKAAATRPPESTLVSVFADLRLDTDGHRVHLVGDGHSLVLHSSDPRQLLSGLRQLSLPSEISGLRGRTAVGQAATALRDAGLRVDVRGPEGVLLQLGRGAGSRVGRWVTGSSAVTFGSLRDLRAAARLPSRTIAALAGVVTGDDADDGTSSNFSIIGSYFGIRLRSKRKRTKV